MTDTWETDLIVFDGRYQEIDGIARDCNEAAISIADPVLLKFMVKGYYTDADSAALITKTSADATEIKKIDTDAGTYRVFLQSEDIEALTGGQEYVYEVILVEDPAAVKPKAYSLNQGDFEVKRTAIRTITS